MEKELDLHGLTTDEAKRLIQKEAKNSLLTSLIVIHGFNNGYKLKELCSKPWNLQCKRIYDCIPDCFNYGRTIIKLRPKSK